MTRLLTPRTNAMLVATLGRDLGELACTYFGPKQRFDYFPDRSAVAKFINRALYAAGADGCFELTEYMSNNAKWWSIVYACYKGGYPALIEWFIHNFGEYRYALDAFDGACRAGNIELAQTIRTRNTVSPFTGLEAACRGNRASTVLYVLDEFVGLGVNLSPYLQIACTKNATAAIRALVEHGATYCDNCGKLGADHLQS